MATQASAALRGLPSAVGPASEPGASRLGDHLQAARQRALLSRVELANRLGVTEETIRRWERGGSKPSFDSLSRLIAVLSLDARSFASGAVAGDDLPPLARRLRDERELRKITQVEAGRLIGVGQATYAGWEIGRASPDHRFFDGIATFLGLSAHDVGRAASSPLVIDTTRWPPLGKLLGTRRAELNMTREQLAGSLNVAPSTIAAWETGYRTPRAQQLGPLAEAVGCAIEDLAATLPRRVEASALGQLIRARQRALGLGTRDLAERARLDQSTLSRWIHGHNTPELAGLSRLAQALKLPVGTVCEAAGL